ncbi:hypothetical protein PInf_015479 [Phytophthora infestans]|nr:hypothetical protein PInf_015479 [Phytophthora infestans]
MVGPVGKTPRHKPTARERQLCLDLRHQDRRVRREEAKEEAAPKKTGAPVKKKAAKETAAKTARASTEPVISTSDGEEGDSVLADLVRVVGSTEGLTTPTHPNMMMAGAEECTELNSDEDSDLQEESEEDDDASYDDDSVDDWDGDWDLGNITDEDSDGVPEELPESIWSSVARNKGAVSAMRSSGWEYDTAKFGPDPEYKDLYRDAYGPSDSVMKVGDDPLALMF